MVTIVDKIMTRIISNKVCYILICSVAYLIGVLALIYGLYSGAKFVLIAFSIACILFNTYMIGSLVYFRFFRK